MDECDFYCGLYKPYNCPERADILPSKPIELPAVTQIKEDRQMSKSQHYGTPGLKWSVRRYKNKDGTLTSKEDFDMLVPKVNRHKALCEKLNEIYEKKNHDYGDSFHETFLEEGFAMSRIRLSDKLSRFKTLSRDASMQKVQDESIRDTLMDLANYAIMTILELDEMQS